VQVHGIFRNEASLSFQFDFFETGIGEGAGTWAGLTETGLTPLAAHRRGRRGTPARLQRANAMALPFRDDTVDAVVTDPRTTT
jgi:putative DNA methylase